MKENKKNAKSAERANKISAESAKKRKKSAKSQKSRKSAKSGITRSALSLMPTSQEAAGERKEKPSEKPFVRIETKMGTQC